MVNGMAITRKRRSDVRRAALFGVAALLWLWHGPAPAATPDLEDGIERCARIHDRPARLDCYDWLARSSGVAARPDPPRERPRVSAPRKPAWQPWRAEADVGFLLATGDDSFGVDLIGHPVDINVASFLGGRGPVGGVTLWYDGAPNGRLSLGLSYLHARISGDATADFVDGVQVIADPVFNDVEYRAAMHGLTFDVGYDLFRSPGGGAFVGVAAGLARLRIETEVRTDSPLLVAPQISRNEDTVLAPLWSVRTGYRVELGDGYYLGAQAQILGVTGALFGEPGRSLWAVSSHVLGGMRF